VVTSVTDIAQYFYCDWHRYWKSQQGNEAAQYMRKQQQQHAVYIYTHDVQARLMI